MGISFRGLGGDLEKVMADLYERTVRREFPPDEKDA